MNIVFTGYYGYKNTGDDAFVEVSSWGAKKYWGDPKVNFLAKSDNLPKTKVKSIGYPFPISKTYRFQKQFLINRADVFIAAGGSTLIKKASSLDSKMLAIKKKERGKNMKIGGIGVSIGPFKSSSDEQSVKEYLKKFDFLALRDNRSYEYACSLDLPYKPVNSFDLAALLPDVYDFSLEKKDNREQKIIGVSVCPYETLIGGSSKIEANRNEKIVQVLKLIEKIGNIHFKFFVINDHQKMGDYNLTKKTILDVAPKSYEVINYTRDTQSMWESIATCDFMISTRLHGAIFACFSNTPFMLNEYHRKCEDFLNNIEYESSYRLHNSNYDPVEKAYLILDILNDSTFYRAPKKLNQMKELAKLNFTEISL